MRMGIGAPDPENDRDMAVWAQGQTNVAGQMRRSPQERAEARGGADRYRQEQESARNRETQVRMADAEREGEWTTDPTGQTAINKRTGETRPTGATGRPQRHVVGKRLVDQDGKVLFDGSGGDEKIEGYTWDEFMDLEKQSWNFTGETADRFEELRKRFYAAAEKRGQKKEAAAAAATVTATATAYGVSVSSEAQTITVAAADLVVATLKLVEPASTWIEEESGLFAFVF